MKRVFNIRDLGWLIAGILFLILIFEILQNRTQRVKQGINPIIKQESVEVVK